MVCEALQLMIFAGDEIEVHPLPQSGSVALGRAVENDVRINAPSVSRRHAVLHLGPPLRVEDLGGANGTFVRGSDAHEEKGATQGLRQISGQAAEIAVGESVTLGSALFVVRHASSDVEIGDAARSDKSLIAHDPAMRALHQEANLAAKSLLSVLLLGETGAGKEVLARSIHAWSPRAKKPFLGLNCAALSESLLESELFGHEKGAFTGATEARRGLLEAVDGGTLFLDEVGDLPPAIQVKLLRVLEERQVLRVGGRTPRRIDVRFISATNRDLDADVARGAFRQDMFYRLNGITLTIPPLRERASEIAPLARLFAARFASALDRREAPALSPEVLTALERYRWPGNIRELRNTLDRAVALCRGPALLLEHLPAKIAAATLDASATRAERPAPSPPRARQELPEPSERERIILALEACAGNQTQAAARLGISRRTLVSRLQEYNLPRPRKRE